MELYFVPLATIATLFFFACASPGPDFINITSYSLVSRKAGFSAAVGAVLGVLILSSVIAVGLLIASNGFSSFYYVLRIVGAAYLAYLGCRVIIGAMRGGEPPLQATKAIPISIIFIRGIATNLSNPKAAFFIASIFTTALPHGAPTIVYILAILTVTLVSSGVYTVVAVTFSLNKVQKLYRHIWRCVDTLLGACFIGLAAKLISNQ
ncbi:LysE family translocator [Acinetobacter sp. C_4_1]|uniref:LysE family translocator n=1 Tax=unclassified Acinetobacter TaxID=196816 RepID=UPI0021B75681|nr:MULTISPECIES: LysE family translocator [unclassified Acinetobacter]MCT8088356.1 LysE family translocator [Acinetobacter sp. F_3_1]MCT8097725.1 LysE family translocator [Acinetobacter sp. C_3_1]MCT8100381.1 LysE family translocator [Acinetobacter sp. C_4_1]MCT8133900.1 LysE family translocator [Acinetobacter sp. T_3_1]